MIKRRRRAIYSVIELAEYMAEVSPQAAERFMDAVEETLSDLERMPGMGHRYDSPRPQLEGIRIWSVKGFRKHLIFYRPTKDGIEVIHVLHGSRDIDAAFARDLEKGEL